ncbi:MAG: hypothetical protein JWO95_2170 [Verrucomicrobiales bacterium]|nr:hypothetical protein [Verrucomicrobiales bacterium]
MNLFVDRTLILRQSEFKLKEVLQTLRKQHHSGKQFVIPKGTSHIQLRVLAMLNCSHHTVYMLADEQPAPEQIAIYRKMTPEQRLKIAERLYWSARDWKAAGIRLQHPDWQEDQIGREVTRIFQNART